MLLKVQGQVLYALVMHDIKSRFFGSGLGYLVMIIWPLAHMLLILAINSGRAVPHGTSMVLYAATAAIPYICSNYIARFIMMGVMQNKAFMAYPIIKAMDIVIARAFLEIISSFIVLIVILTGMTLFGIDVMPIDPGQAAAAWGAAVFLGIGLGMVNGMICIVFPMWTIAVVFMMIGCWITCGVTIDPESLPDNYAYIISFNPVMHAVEWARQSYYIDYRPRLLDKTYLIAFALVSLVLGLLLDRFARAFLLNPR